MLGLTLLFQPAALSSEAEMAFRLHYDSLVELLPSHISIVASSSISEDLIPAGVISAVMDPALPSSGKVTKLLDEVEKQIHEDNKKLERFVEVLRNLGSYLKVVGNSLDSTYRE